MKILWKDTVSAKFPHQELGEITVFYAVYINIQKWLFPKTALLFSQENISDFPAKSEIDSTKTDPILRIF